MQITITNDGTVPAEYELGVNPKVLLQPGESIAVDLTPQSPVIVRVPENLAEQEERARKLAEAKALIAEEEAANAKAEEEAKAAAKEKAKAEKAAKKAAEQQNGGGTGEKTGQTVTDPADGEQKPAETGEQTTDLFPDSAPDGQSNTETGQENTR